MGDCDSFCLKTALRWVRYQGPTYPGWAFSARHRPDSGYPRLSNLLRRRNEVLMGEDRFMDAVDAGCHLVDTLSNDIRISSTLDTWAIASPAR